MPIDASELTALRDALIRARAQGVRVASVDGKRVEYASDAEMAAALADLERRMRGASSAPKAVRILGSKGL